MPDEPLVSIIIPTYNSEKTLPLCLESIRRQTYRNIEVIVVDNFSTDRTVEIARSYGAKVIQVRGERAKAKNVGLRHARGKYVLFIDSDMELTPKVVEECVKLAESNPRIGGIIIPERSVGNSYWAKVRDFERSFYTGTPIESARFFRRDLALQVGGYDEDIVFYEEATLPQKIEKLGYNVRARITSPILHHEEDFSLSKWVRKKYYYGKTAWKYLSRYKKYAVYQMNPLYRFGLLLLKNRNGFHKQKLLFGVLLLKILEYLASSIGYIINKTVNIINRMSDIRRNRIKVSKKRNDKIKIGIIVDTSIVGGVQKMAAYEAKILNNLLSNSRFDVRLLVLDSNPDILSKLLTADHSKVLTLMPKIRKIVLPPFNFLTLNHIIFLLHFASKIKEYDIIIAHNIIAALPVYVSRLLFNKPTVFMIYYHDLAYKIAEAYFGKEHIMTKLVKIIEKAIIEKADILIANAPNTASVIRETYNKKATVIYPGASYVPTTSCNEKKNIDIIFITRWDKLRDFSTIIKLAQFNPSAKIVIAGNWIDSKLKSKIEKLVLRYANISLLDSPLKEEDLYEIYRQSKIYVQTNPTTFGLPALEALLNGCIPIVWNASGVSTIFKTEGLKYFIINDLSELIKRISVVLDNYHTFCRLVLTKLQNLRQKYSWYSHALRLLLLLHETLKHKLRQG